MIATESETQREPNVNKSLCPSCGGASLRVDASATIQYDVRAGGRTKSLEVVGERVSGDGWEPTSGVTCPACGWEGTVGEIEVMLTW